jgi:hypothetical protein
MHSILRILLIVTAAIAASVAATCAKSDPPAAHATYPKHTSWPTFVPPSGGGLG